MQVKAYQDLGALGLAEGPASVYNWTPPSRIPSLLPWLALLALLLVKSNRRATAWLIWVPVASGFGIRLALQKALSFAPASAIEMFGDTVIGLTFGLAAVWLLGRMLAQQPRILVFFLGSILLCFFGVLAAVGQAGGELGALEMIPVAIMVCVIGSAQLLVLTLAGIIARRRYRPAPLCGWIGLLVLGLSALVITPFAAVSIISGQQVPLGVLGASIGGFAGGAFVVLLPFLLLSFSCELYRERLKGMLRLGETTAPPVIPPRQGVDLPPQIQPTAATTLSSSN